MRDKAEDIYERYAQIVYRFLFSLTGEADIAEELTQETFYQAIKSMDTYLSPSRSAGSFFTTFSGQRIPDFMAPNRFSCDGNGKEDDKRLE